MPQSLSLVIVQIVFSTMDRFPCLDPSTRPHLHAYLATVARNAKCEGYRVGGSADMGHSQWLQMNFRRWWLTWKIKKSIIGSGHFKKNTWNC